MSDPHASGDGGGVKILWGIIGVLAAVCILFMTLWPDTTSAMKQGAINLSVGAAVTDLQRNFLIGLGIGLAGLIGAVCGVIAAVLMSKPAAAAHH